MPAPIVETHALGKSFGLTPVLNDTEFSHRWPRGDHRR